MISWTSPSMCTPPVKRLALAGALALALVDVAAQAAPVAPLGAPFKLNGSPPDRIRSLDVELNHLGAGVALWQRLNEDGRYATYFKRFDRYGSVAGLQTHELTNTLNPARLLKVFDNGEFAIESRQGTVLKITIRDRNGAVARNLRDIQCRTAAGCRAVMDDLGKVIVGDVATISGRSHPVVQLLNAAGTVVKPWFVVDQPATGITGAGRAIVAADADGDFAVGWKASPSFGVIQSDQAAFIRLYQKNGLPKGGQFSAHTTYVDDELDLAMDADGDFVVTWTQGPADEATIEFGHSVYRKDGTRVAEGIHGSGYMWDWDWIDDKIVMDDDGDYAVLSDHEAFPGYGIDTGSLDAKLYRSFSNVSLGNREMVRYFFDHWENPDSGSPTVSGDLAMDGKGHLAALWLFHGTPDSPPGLFLQRFTGPLGEGCGGAGATLVGTNAANTINGTAGDDVINGLGGNDVIHGNGGNDTYLRRHGVGPPVRRCRNRPPVR